MIEEQKNDSGSVSKGIAKPLVSSRCPIRIHYSLLPKQIKNFEVDENGFLHGFFVFNERDYKASFMNENELLFECSRPVIVCQTHLLIRYNAVVYTGYNKIGKQIGEICELTAFFNGR